MNLGLSSDEIRLQHRARELAQSVVAKRGVEIDLNREYP
jgi:hypothetical protein